MDLRKKITSLFLVGSLGVLTVAYPLDVRANEQVEESTTEVDEEKTEVVENEESLDTSEDVASVEEDTTKNVVEKDIRVKDFKLEYWEYSDETQGIVLTKYKADSPKDVYIPGEHNGKQVILSTISTSTSINAGVIPTDINSMVIEEVNSKKVKVNSTDLSTAFYLSKAKTLDLGGLDVSNVTNMLRMFHGCLSLTRIDGLSNWDTSNVTDMTQMFYNVQQLTELNVSNWDTSNVRNMSGMFENSIQLTRIDGLSGWDTSNVKDMSNMFTTCKALIELNLSGWDTSQVTNMSKMFYNCQSLTHIDGLSGWKTPKVTSMMGMFRGCKSLVTELNLSNWKTSNVTDMEQMFYECHVLTKIDGISDWDTSQVTSMKYMFSNCESLTQLNISRWNTSQVTNMRYMFTACKALTALNLSEWNTSKVTDMSYMFRDCTSLTELDLSKWNVASNIFMSEMFKVTSITPFVVITDTPKLKTYNYVRDKRTYISPTFDANGGQFQDGSTTKKPFSEIVYPSRDAIDQSIDDAIATFETPTRGGIDFVGWTKGVTSSSSIFDKLSMTITANWKTNNPTVTFMDGNVEVGKNEVAIGDSITPPNITAKPGHMFEGWYEKDGNGNYTKKWDFANDKMPDSDLTLYTKWVPVTIIKYPKDIVMSDEPGGNSIAGKGMIVLDTTQGELHPTSKIKVYAEDGNKNDTPDTVTMTGGKDTFEATIYDDNGPIADRVLGTLEKDVNDTKNRINFSLKYVKNGMQFKDGVKFTGILKFTFEMVGA